MGHPSASEVTLKRMGEISWFQLHNKTQQSVNRVHNSWDLLYNIPLSGSTIWLIGNTQWRRSGVRHQQHLVSTSNIPLQILFKFLKILIRQLLENQHTKLFGLWYQFFNGLYNNFPMFLNSLRPSGAIWQHRSGSTLAQVMACCLMAPSHYLSQCWLIINKVQWHSSEGNFAKDISATNH